METLESHPSAARSARSACSLLFALLAAACAVSPQQRARDHVDTMVGCIERLQQETERSKVALADSLARLEALTTKAPAPSDRQAMTAAYLQFVQGIDAAEQQCTKLAEVLGPMQDAARTVFEQWQIDAATIGAERLRQRSEARLAEARSRFEAIVATAGPAQQQFAACVKALRDRATFLAHDLNPGSIAALRQDDKETESSVRAAQKGLDDCAAAARTYVAQATPPEGRAPAAAPR